MDLLDAYVASGHIHELAAAVRTRAQLAGELSGAIAWQSLAGAVFRAKADAVCSELVALSSAMDRLADAVHDRATALAHAR